MEIMTTKASRIKVSATTMCPPNDLTSALFCHSRSRFRGAISGGSLFEELRESNGGTVDDVSVGTTPSNWRLPKVMSYTAERILQVVPLFCAEVKNCTAAGARRFRGLRGVQIRCEWPLWVEPPLPVPGGREWKRRNAATPMCGDEGPLSTHCCQSPTGRRMDCRPRADIPRCPRFRGELLGRRTLANQKMVNRVGCHKCGVTLWQM